LLLIAAAGRHPGAAPRADQIAQNLQRFARCAPRRVIRPEGRPRENKNQGKAA
jgi:hypothetical protein